MIIEKRAEGRARNNKQSANEVESGKSLSTWIMSTGKHRIGRANRELEG